MKGVNLSMTIQWNKDDLFYVCTMIEYVSRKTNNKSKDVVVRISDKALAHQLKVAGINHCLSFEQVADEWIEELRYRRETMIIFQNADMKYQP